MRTRRMLVAATGVFVVVFGIIFAAPKAVACPGGQHSSCLGPVCGCVPNLSPVVVFQALNPLPDVLNTADGVIHGDVQKINQGIGGLIIQGTCSACAVAAQSTLSNADRAFVETVVGRGWLVYLTTESPSLVMADAATSVTKEYKLTHPEPNPLQPPPPVTRSQQSYHVDGALCAISSGSQVIVGWVDTPTFVNSTGGRFVFPGVDLQQGDLLSINAANAECGKRLPGEKAYSQVVMRYAYIPPPIPTTNPKAMKWFVVGDLSSGQ